MISAIKINDFLSIRKINIVGLEKANTIGVTGSYTDLEGYSNGSGKSALLESIHYALTGQHRAKTDGEIIRIGADECIVKVLFLVGDDTVSVERILRWRHNKEGEKTKTVSTAVVRLNSEIVASSTTAANAWLEEYFNTTADDFVNSSYFKQKDYDTFLKNRSGKRMSFLENFFEITIFDTAKRQAQKNVAATKKVLDGVDGKIEALEEQLAEIDGEQLQCDLGDTTANIDSLLVDEKTYMKKLDALSKSIETANKKITEKEAVLQQIEAVEKRIAEKSKTIEELKGTIDESDTSIQSVSEQIKLWQMDLPGEQDCIFNNAPKLDKFRLKLMSLSSLSGQLTQAKATIISNRKEIKKDTCVTCKRPITPSLKEKLIASSSKELQRIENEVKKTEQEISTIKDKIEDLEEEWDDVNLLKEKRIDLEKKLIEATGQLRRYKQEKKKAASDLTKAAEERDALFEEKAVLYSKIEFDAVKHSSELAALIKKRGPLEEKLSDVREELSEERETLGSIKADLETAIKCREKVEALQDERRELFSQIADESCLIDILDKCRVEALKTGLSELQTHANDIIGEIGAVQREIEFDTQKETQSGTVLDSLDIYMIDQKGKRDVQLLCGGEKDSTAFSIRAALSRYKLCRMDSKIDFLILDEVFGALDDVSRTELISIINRFKNDFAQVFVISHTDLQDVFDYNICVQMGKDGITRLVN